MKLPQGFLHKGKTAIHGLQALVIFLAWALTMAILIQTGPTDGRTKYFFALCWFCVPVLIYQTAVPTFQRTKRFANPYAHAALDALFTIFWFAAFIAVAVWTNAGISEGQAKDKDGKLKGCAAFNYGSGTKCKLSQATVGMGVTIFLLFILSSAISIYSLFYYRKNGSLPDLTTTDPTGATTISDQTKYAFSSQPHQDDDFEDVEALGPSGRSGGRQQDDDEYELLHPDAEDGGRPLSWERDHAPSPLGHRPGEVDTSYPGASYGQGGIGAQGQRLHDGPPRVEYEPDHDTSYHGGGGYMSGPTKLTIGGGDPFRDDLALSHDHGGYAAGSSSGRVDFPAADYTR